MDFYNPDDWTKLETAFTSAPRWALIAAASTVGCLLGWFLQSTKSAGKIGGLEGQIDELNVRIDSLKDRNLLTEERMKFTAEKAAIAGEVEDELKKRIQSLEMGIADKADIAALSALATEVKSGFANLAAANNAVSSSLFVALKVTEAADVAGFTVDTNSLDFALYGAHRKLDPETLKKLEGVGKVPGLTLNSIPDDVKKRE
jgi:TolA-binding protein